MSQATTNEMVEVLSSIFAVMDRREKLRAEMRETDLTLAQLFATLESDEDAMTALAAVRETLEKRPRARETTASRTPVEPLAIQPSSIAAALEEPTEADKFADDFKNTLNHRSGCGYDVDVLRKRILDYLIAHGGDGRWLSRSNMCHATDAWRQFGKRVIDPLLERMVAEGSIEVRSTPEGRQVRLTAGTRPTA